MIRRAVCAALALCMVFGAQAQTLRFKNFASPSNAHDTDLNKIYLAGVRDALQTINGSLVAQGAAPLFCLPPKLVFAEEQAEDIVTRTAQKATRNIDDVPVAIILLRGLKEDLPLRRRAKQMSLFASA